jgi:GTP cyclohydrolase II
MKKRFVSIWCSCVVACGTDIPQEYPRVKENLIIFKDDRLKVYNGGPVEKKNGGVQWIVPVVFENEKFKPRAVYEISFVNCIPEDASGLKVFYIEVSDIDAKFKNQLNDNYQIFSSLLSGDYDRSRKYVVIRKADVSMVTFPDAYVEELQEHKDEISPDRDIRRILSFLRHKYRVQSQVTHIKTSPSIKSDMLPLPASPNSLRQVQAQQIVFASPVKILSKIKDSLCPLYVTKAFIREDPWEIYYIISKNSDLSLLRNRKIFVRVDSGCVDGQIYGDDSCDCADQLFDFALNHVTEDEGIVLHIPCHDGRGFGFAPKAETEIYKQGGAGRIHTTNPMDTVSAAKLLYEANDYNYDIRDYEGAASILMELGCDDIRLCTDSRKKVNALAAAGIRVERVPTETHKSTCQQHIRAKKNNPLFFDSFQ